MKWMKGILLFCLLLEMVVIGCSSDESTLVDSGTDIVLEGDCNDPRVGTPCEVGIGECKSTGKYICKKETLEVVCDAVAGRPKKEICDGKDNDCDGKIDEDFKELGSVCEIGEGQCKSTGTYTCSEDGSGVICNAPVLYPSDEICDGLDNNCDGETDELFDKLGNECEVGLGECAVKGLYICSSDGRDVVCDAIPGEPQQEICDGKDNNCDGFTDEDFADLGKPCFEGLGECRTEGKYVCSSDGTAVICDAEPGRPQVELCDKKDNNCDGFTDEGAPNCSVILAGNMKTPYKAGRGLSETYFIMPYGIFYDMNTDELFVSDYIANVIFNLKYDDVTRAYTSEIYSGLGFRGDETGDKDSSKYSGPTSMAMDKINKRLIVLDTLNNKIKAIDVETFTTTTIAGNGKIGVDNGVGEDSSFYYPMGVVVDSNGIIYVADTYNHCIRKVTYDTSKQKYVVDTFAGSCGTLGNTDASNPLNARFNMPTSLAITASGDIFVADRGNKRVRLISQSSGVSTYVTISGADITSLAVDEFGYLFIVDYNGSVRQVSPTLQVQTIISGLKAPISIVLGKNSSAFITESKSGMIRKVNLSNGSFTFIAGRGRSMEPGSDYSTPLSYPMGVFYDENKVEFYVSNTYSNRLLLISNWKAYNISGDGIAGSSDTNLYLPTKMTKWGDDIYFSDTNNHCVKKISYDVNTDTYITTVVGGRCGVSGNANGDRDSSRFNSPHGVELLDDKRLLIVDTLNHCIRVLENGLVSTYSGRCGTAGKTDGASNIATFNSPEDIVCNRARGECYVADTGNNLIRKIAQDGSVERYAGSPNNTGGGYNDGERDEALFNRPAGISLLVNFDESVTLYVADRNNHVIRKIDSTGSVSTILGKTLCSSEYGERDSTGFCFPSDIQVTSDGSIIVVDSGNNRVLGIY